MIVRCTDLSKQLFISNHKQATLRTIETELNLFFALLQASTGERLGKNKTVFHKGILRDFLGMTLPVNR